MIHRLVNSISVSILVLVLGILFVPFFAHALDVNDQTSLVLTLSPEYPKAGDNVLITAESSAVDLNRSNIVWYVDDKVVQQGTALTTLYVTAGSYGTIKNVRVAVINLDGKVVESTTSIVPAEVSLLWQTNTYTPPFYKGKALYTNGSDITIIAIPTSNSYKASNLIYKWRKNGEVIPYSGGLGKDTVTIKNQLISFSNLISVEVSSVDGTYQAYNQINITPTNPQVLVYENNPILGIRYEHALGNNDQITNDEIQLEAQPYFFSTENRFFDLLAMTWSVNGVVIPSATNKTSIVVQRNNGASDVSIDLSVSHKLRPLQTAQKRLQFLFK